MTTPLSQVGISNYALTRIGSTQRIASFDPAVDASNEAAVCALFYPQCRDELLRDFPWPWSSAYAELTQINAVGVAANSEWLYSYRYPADCLFLRRLTCAPIPQATSPPQTTGSFVHQWPTPLGNRSDTDPYPAPFEIGHDVDGRLIYTQLPNVWCKYTMAVTDPTQFAPDFASLLAWRLAMELAYGLAISDSRREFAVKMYEREKMTVRGNAFNESQNSQPFVTQNSEFIRARWSGLT